MSILDDINAAVELMRNRPPEPPCGVEDNPHRYFGSPRVGERVSCAVCGESLIVLPNGRAMLYDPFKAMGVSPRLLNVDLSSEAAAREYQYVGDYRLSHSPPRFYMDRIEGEHESRVVSLGGAWGRRMRRAMKRNRTRSAKRTDFGRRIELYRQNAARGIYPAGGDVRAGAMVSLRRDGTIVESASKD